MSRSSGDSAIPSSQQSERFHAAFEHLGVAAARLSLDGTCLWVNQKFCDLTGYSGQEMNGNLLFLEGVAEDHDLQRLISQKIAIHSAEKNARRKDGHIVVLRAVFSVLHDPSRRQPPSLLVLMEEISNQTESDGSQRKLAERLIKAQEAERTRIARELHDDIGQELAILCVQMQRAGQPVSGVPGKRHPDLYVLTNRVRDIAEKVSRISHQLHSSKLEYLGLRVAVESTCREFAAGARIAIDCTCQQVPAKVDDTVGVCFLRVVQEALHNIGKHSGAKRAEVSLSGSGNHLNLVITDDGVGFDVEAAQLASGLGLLSMRERLHLIGGQFEITSQAGKGTRIRASAPITFPLN